jgi:hypothetical protein
MAIDRPGAIAAALDSEPERSGGRRAPTCLMREECRRSRRGKEVGNRRCGKAIEAQPTSGQIKPSRGPYDRDRTRRLKRRLAPNALLDTNEGRREMVRRSKRGQRPRSAACPGPGRAPCRLISPQRGPAAGPQAQPRSESIAGDRLDATRPTAGLSMAKGANPSDSRGGLSFAADRPRHHARNSRTDGQ